MLRRFTLATELARAGRALRRAPAFTMAAVFTLALGIGATTAIFTIVNAVLLAPLPYGDADRRVMIWSRWTAFDKTWVSDREVLDYRERCRTLADVAAWGRTQANLTGGGEPIRVGAAAVTANAFAVFGARPAHGRTFAPGEDEPGRDRVVVLADGLWRRRYAGDPRTVGRPIQVNGTTFTVIGIMPPGFRMPTDYGRDAAEPTELWMPYRLEPTNRGSHGLFAAAALAPGATLAQANAELAAVTAALTREGFYDAAMRFTAVAVGLDDEVRGRARGAVWLLFGAVGCLLLIACANVANLLLVRADTRHREVAVRAALGAAVWRLARELLAESAWLSAAGTALGMAFAMAILRLLARLGAPSLPRVGDLALDVRVLAFTAAVGVATTVLFSLVPLVRSARVDLVASLKEGGHQGGVGLARQRMRTALVIAEVALAVVLVIGAALMARTLTALARVDLGFEPAGVLTARVALPATSYGKPEQVTAFFRTLAERVRTLPGVQAAGVVRSLPLADEIGDWGLDVEGYVETPGHTAKGDWQVASDGALEALGERLVRGRTFTAADGPDSQQIALVNETMARAYWPDGNPIGRRIRMGSDPARPWLTVVGIVADVRHNGIDGMVKGKFYRPHAQFHVGTGEAPRSMILVIRSAGDPLALAPAVRATVQALDRDLPVANIRTMTEVLGTAIATPRLTGFLLGLFGVLALALATIGVYGVLASVVAQRTQEIGIRMAIGAEAGDVLRLVLRRGLLMAIAGVAVGLAAALAATRSMTTVLYGVTPTDPLTFAAVAALIVAVALAASFVPARRAANVDPICALRG